MKVFSLPEHVDIIPVVHKFEHVEVLNRLKNIGIEFDKLVYHNSYLDNLNISALKKIPHYVTLNTGKAVFGLFLTTINSQRYAYLINKNCHSFWLIPCEFNEEAYTSGTLFEVDLIRLNDSHASLPTATVPTAQTTVPSVPSVPSVEHHLDSSSKSYHYKLLLLITDLYAYQGKPLLNQSLNHRYQLIVDIFTKSQYCYTSDRLFEYQFKPLTTDSHLESLWYDFVPKLSYRALIKGVMFRTDSCYPFSNWMLDLPPDLRRPPRIISEKTSDCPVNFLVRRVEGVDRYQLYAYNDLGQLTDFGYALLNDLNSSRILNIHLSRNPERVFLCEYDPHFDKWRPIQLSTRDRPDMVKV